MEGHERLLTVKEVALLFGVDPKTVRRWLAGGKLAAAPTPGGHWRIRASDVRAIIEDQGGTANG